MIELLMIGFFALLVSSALAPLEALGWWAGWRSPRRPPDPPRRRTEPAAHYLVYLSGISAIAGDSININERRLLDELERSLPDTVVVRDVFPYSVNNTGLNGERMFAWLWRQLERLRLRNPRTLLVQLVNIRNLFQVAVSADERYGPIFNYGVAEEIVAGLRRAGYPDDGNVPITVFGWSGGAQIAVGSAPFLARTFAAPLQVISLGGVVAADQALDGIHRVYHLYGTRDSVQRFSALLFPGRWRLALESPWNRARVAGRLREMPVGPMRHRGPRNYFDHVSRLPEGDTYAQRTLSVLLDALRESGVTVRTTQPDDRPSSAGLAVHRP